MSVRCHSLCKEKITFPDANENAVIAVSFKMTALASAHEEMQRDVATLRFFVAIVLAVVSVLLVVVLWRTHNLAATICDAGR